MVSFGTFFSRLSIKREIRLDRAIKTVITRTLKTIMNVSEENPAKTTFVGTSPNEAQVMTTRIPGKYSRTNLKIHMMMAADKMAEKIAIS
jgi:hypothetical protein